jgi:hypothetical protein
VGGCARRIGIIGLSVGGHLIARAATYFDAGQADGADSVERLRCRPDFSPLGYPVITINRGS